MRQVSVWALVMLLSLALAAPGVSWAGGKVPRVDKDTLKSWLLDSQVIILDVRIPSDWQESKDKIKGALRKVPGQVKIWGPSLPKDKKIVVYCD